MTRLSYEQVIVSVQYTVEWLISSVIPYSRLRLLILTYFCLLRNNSNNFSKLIFDHRCWGFTEYGKTKSVQVSKWLISRTTLLVSLTLLFLNSRRILICSFPFTSECVTFSTSPSTGEDYDWRGLGDRYRCISAFQWRHSFSSVSHK